MALNSIQQEWAAFAGMIFAGTEPGPHQVAEMQKAFFAGAWSLLVAIEEIGRPHVSEDQAHAYLDARRQELKEFVRRLLAEYSERN